MKTKTLFLSAFIALLLTSCQTTTSFYQVYKTIPNDKIKTNENFLVFEDNNCRVSYDLWENGGNCGFRFYNKTDVNIYLNLEETFFILNDVSYNYYKNRVYTTSASTGSSASHGASAAKSVTGLNYLDLLQTNQLSSTNSFGVLTSSGYSVSYNEEKIICIPAKTSKVIKEYNINQALFRDCELYKYPRKKQIKTLSFTKSNSPLVFSNRIEYKVGITGTPILFENEFYVSEITNFPESEMFESKYEKYCEQQSIYLKEYFKNYSPDKFYFKYTKGNDQWEH